MGGYRRFPRSPVPWAVVTEQDLEPKGKPEYTRSIRTPLAGPERQIGLHVTGQYADSLGLLAIRCAGRDERDEAPMSCAIADTPLVVSDQADGAA